MRSRARLLLALAAASLVLLAAQPVAAHRDWRWNDDNRYHLGQLQQACDWGDRWACVQMGRIIGQRREARRQYRYRNALPRYGWSGSGWYPPPSGFHFRFEAR